MSFGNKILSFFNLSTPLVTEELNMLLSNKVFSEQLLKDIEIEKKSYISDKTKTCSIKRIT